MNSEQLQKISEEAEVIQLAVKILLSNPCFGPECRPQLRFFLRNRLDKSDLETLNTLTSRGQANYLAERFRSYLAREPRQPG